jgi:hypothetical protein
MLTSSNASAICSSEDVNGCPACGLRTNWCYHGGPTARRATAERTQWLRRRSTGYHPSVRHDTDDTDDTDDTLTRRPAGVGDDTIAAVGQMSEALEYVERARGHLYSFHQLIGHADRILGEACDKLRAAGHGATADRLETELVGRNVLHGRWTFQVVEEFDDGYWTEFRDHERRVRDELQQGDRHVFEAMMKEERRTHGRIGHEARP